MNYNIFNDAVPWKKNVNMLWILFIISMTIVLFSYILTTQLKTKSKKKNDPKNTCRCFRGGDSFILNNKKYDKGFCGQCKDGVRYACPAGQCDETCSDILYTGETCDSCRDPSCKE